jgi:hypothetical protein
MDPKATPRLLTVLSIVFKKLGMKLKFILEVMSVSLRILAELLMFV